MSDTASLFKERVQLYKDAARHKKTSRVLNLANIWTWKICDSGYKLSEALFDYNKMEEIVGKFQEKYKFDYYMDFGLRNPLRIADALGFTDYLIDDKGCALSYATDITYMVPEDYDVILEDYNKFLWTRAIPGRYTNLRGPNGKEMLKKAARELVTYQEFCAHMNNKMEKDYGVPQCLFNGVPTFFNFFETLYLAFRGMKALSMDLRKIPNKVKAVCQAQGNGQGFKTYRASTKPGTDMQTGPDFSYYLLAHVILSKKQFEEFYWPYLKEVFDFCEKYDKIVHIFNESENSRLYEFYKQAPKGHVVVHFENDDLFKAKKEIGDEVCLCGGMPFDLLARGTKKDCIAYAKRLIDELAADGGFIFSQDKMISYPSDCSAENLKAVNEFVSEYRI
jgi:hypothetical protein